MESKLTQRIEELELQYPTAPIIQPEELQNPEIIQTAKALIKAEQQKPEILKIPTYTLPERLQAPDPRNILKRAYDSLAMKLLPESKAAGIAQRIKDQKDIAEAKMQYNWLMTATQTIRTALEQQQAAYKNISAYLQNTNNLIDQAKTAAQQGEKTIEHLLNQADKLEADVQNGEIASQIEQSLGSEGAQQALQRLRQEAKDNKQEATKTHRANEYLTELTGHYSHVTAACKESLQTIEDAISTSRKQVFGLAQTLNTYQGLTQNQILAIEATKFLRDAQTVTNALQQSMTTVHNMLATETEAYMLTAPSGTVTAPDPVDVKIGQELRMLTEHKE